MHALDGRMGLEMAGQRQGRVAAALQAQRQRLGTDQDAVGGLAGQGAAHVAQALLADLLQAPAARVALAVGRKDVGIARPVEAAGVGDGAAQGLAMVSTRTRSPDATRTTGATRAS